MSVATKANGRLEERFNLWDHNGNGVIERSDFEQEIQGILDRFGADPQGPGAAGLRAAYLGLFDRLARAAGTEQMSKDDFISAAESEIVSRGNAGFSEVLQPTIQAIMGIADTDGDGEISPVELERWFAAIGLSADQAGEAFSQIDTDNDGHLSVGELVAAVRDYHLGKNDIPLLGV
ncbi:EF-hand domain-containing protein [Nocardiopsis flavescens]|uniref:Ca2+-binding protein, EF-hand superfamily n=1 Tax=Nocardiopsis flavescens TaxID=758803 RepID=A0A1M6L1V2_9ACTN|nr:EF-hand domain-containing protein [Nocardiopsis flavescens]SHJ65136.1 Ca2+-binding protein, EF-hand superfamily [Nocardiopsis flavescens]